MHAWKNCVEEEWTWRWLLMFMQFWMVILWWFEWEQDVFSLHELTDLQLVLSGIILLRPVGLYKPLYHLNFYSIPTVSDFKSFWRETWSLKVVFDWRSWLSNLQFFSIRDSDDDHPPRAVRDHRDCCGYPSHHCQHRASESSYSGKENHRGLFFIQNIIRHKALQLEGLRNAKIMTGEQSGGT